MGLEGEEPSDNAGFMVSGITLLNVLQAPPPHGFRSFSPWRFAPTG